MAVGSALGPVVYASAMNGRGKGKSAAASLRDPLGGEPAAAPTFDVHPASDGHKEPRRRRRGGGTALEERVGYRFTDANLLECALTHISALKGARNRTGSYQRLEFLGDHVLGLVISDILYRGFPKADEGELSRRLADLVRKETCAEIARTIELGTAIKLGASEANAGGRKRPAILADVCEALIGAVYLDGGFVAASSVVERLWQARMQATTAAAARSQNRAAGMGAGAWPADAVLSRSSAVRPRPRSGVSGRCSASELCARRRLRTFQARRRAGGRRRHAGARAREARNA